MNNLCIQNRIKMEEHKEVPQDNEVNKARGLDLDENTVKSENKFSSSGGQENKLDDELIETLIIQGNKTIE